MRTPAEAPTTVIQPGMFVLSLVRGAVLFAGTACVTTLFACILFAGEMEVLLSLLVLLASFAGSGFLSLLSLVDSVPVSVGSSVGFPVGSVLGSDESWYSYRKKGLSPVLML